MPALPYLRLTFELAAAEEDFLAAALGDLDTLGLEVDEAPGGQVRVHAWFAHPAIAELPADEQWRALGARLVAREEVTGADWMAPWRRASRPFALGRRLAVDPGEPSLERSAFGGRRLLRLPAREAFGTGGHVSTRLAVELLEEEPLCGRRVLDLGAGTGILCFAALVFGARQAAGLEVDLAACLVAGQNRALNRLWPNLVAGSLDCLGQGTFDLAVANMIAEELLPLLPRLGELVAPGGGLIVSGLLVAEEVAFLPPAAAAGFIGSARRACNAPDADWVALRLDRAVEGALSPGSERRAAGSDGQAGRWR